MTTAFNSAPMQAIPLEAAIASILALPRSVLSQLVERVIDQLDSIDAPREHLEDSDNDGADHYGPTFLPECADIFAGRSFSGRA